ncbi:hypothetical protein [Nocardioides sp. TF02-7]|uniref:hypothetical protein n=1 Tax=Nocardioides sp. TF02-7 TaxID=2917724 RepID=UPI001F0587E7|nr:hypothetical protein [Nocardioides sp. TF02-7]UMG94993.1 hypothetical protein MF408_01455 [Nocardioides sp. TF02-7]
MLVSDDGVDVGAVGRDVWYPLWDSGARLDHAVRTLPEVLDAAAADVRVAAGMLDVRHVAGDPGVSLRLRSTVLAQWRRDARERLPELRAKVRDRHRLAGELAHLSVPDLKEAEGGLRDATVLKGLAATWLVDVPAADLERTRRQLLDVRDLLHATAGRAADRIGPEHWAHARRGARPARRAGRAAARPRAGAAAHPPLPARVAPRRRRAAPRTGRTAPPPRPRAAGTRRGAGERRGGARPRGPARPRPRPAAPSGGGGRRARRGAGAVDGGPARPGVPAAARAVARRGPPPAGAAARVGAGAPRRLGRPSTRLVPSTGSFPSGSGSACCRTRRRSTGSPSTGTSSRPASRPQR